MDESDNGLTAAHQADVLNDLMLEFVLTGRREVLAKFLEFGGELDNETSKGLLISLLRNEFRADNKGGKNAFESYQVYVGVRAIMTRREVSKTAACEEYSRTIKTRTPRAIEISFSKGAKVAAKFSGNRR